MVINIDEINKLQAQNKGLIEQNKQLQQDISTLQGKLDAYQMSENEANEIIAELKAENERLKEENKTLEQFLSKEPLALQALQKGYASYKESTEVFYEMVKKYKQTLQEIKVIVCGNYEIIDPQGRKDILKLITKAEEK